MNKFLVFLIAALLTTSSALAKEMQVKGYTKKDGTVVAPHTRILKDKTTPASDTIQVKGYTRKDGTKVASYTRKKPKSK